MADGELDVGDQIHATRAAGMPCFCDATTGTELLDASKDGRIEKVGCASCRRRWTRIWVGALD